MPVKNLSEADGVSEPAGNDAWDAALNLDGVDLTAGLSPDVVESVVDASQLDDAGSSAGAGSDGTGTPQSAPVGDAGTQAPASDGAGPVAASPAATDPAPAGAAAPDVTPEPFAFTVDGKSETIDGAVVIPGDGLYVPDPLVPQFRDMASQARSLDTQLRAEKTHRDAAQAEVEQWNRLATHTFKNDKGEDVTLSGRQGWEAQRIEAVSDKAALHVLVGAVTDPEKFNALILDVKVDAAGNQVPPDADGRWIRVLDRDAWSALTRESALTIREKRLALKDEMAQRSAPLPPPEPTAATFADGTITGLAEQYALSALTPDDRAVIRKNFEAWGTRPATPEERKHYGVPRLVLPEFVEFMKDRNASRAELSRVATEAAANATKTATAAGKANGFNAGMNKGRTPAPVARVAQPVAAAPTGRMVPKPKTEQTANDIWAALRADAATVVSG